jgi:hypothetical protein
MGLSIYTLDTEEQEGKICLSMGGYPWEGIEDKEMVNMVNIFGFHI